MLPRMKYDQGNLVDSLHSVLKMAHVSVLYSILLPKFEHFPSNLSMNVYRKQNFRKKNPA